MCFRQPENAETPPKGGTRAVLQKRNRETALGACPQIIAPASEIRPD